MVCGLDYDAMLQDRSPTVVLTAGQARHQLRTPPTLLRTVFHTHSNLSSSSSAASRLRTLAPNPAVPPQKGQKTRAEAEGEEGVNNEPKFVRRKCASISLGEESRTFSLTDDTVCVIPPP